MKSVPIGPDNYSIYTHYIFSFGGVNNKLTDFEVQNTNPVNLTNGLVTFTYETRYDLRVEVKGKYTLQIYAAFCYVLLFIIIFLFCKQKAKRVRIMTVPSNTFLISIFTGSGGGLFAFLFSLSMLTVFIPDQELWFILVECLFASAFVNGLVTSLVCSLFRMGDIGSALYFAPLFFPSICIALTFSVYWIPICVGSCNRIPMNGIFIFIFIVAFIKLPVNLISGLMMKKFIKIKHYKVRTLNLPNPKISRTTFFIFSNCLFFMLFYPLLNHLFHKILSGFERNDFKLILIFIPLWLLSSFCIGIGSLIIKGESDWAYVSFLASLGSPVTLFLVFLLKLYFLSSSLNTLEISLHSFVSSIICLGIAFTTGSTGILSAIVWIVNKGAPIN